MVRVTISELEETIDVMVKASSNGGANKLEKPFWWPASYQFPLKRRPGVHSDNWRETLCYVISKCNQYKTKRLRRKPKRIQCGTSSAASKKRRDRKLKRKNVVKSANMGVRRDSTGSSHGSTVSSVFGGTATPLAKQATIVSGASSTVVCNGGGSGTSCGEVSAATVLAKNFGLSVKMPTPFVQVYDVCKVNPSILNIINNNNYIKIEKNDDCDDIKSDINLEKSNFMNYFGLNMTKSESVPSSQNPSQIKSNKNNIINCPHIPFSSNVGQKLMQGWHTYDTEVVEKRLERLERYLCNNDLPSLLTPIKDNFEVSNKSKTNFSHFYIFPTKKRHRKGKLTPRARFLLTKYCKPCSVNLSTSKQHIENYLSRKNENIIAFIDLTNTEDEAPQQKENKTPVFTLLESRVVLTTIDGDKFKENSQTSAALVKKSARTTLQTLTPRNENLAEPKTATETNKKLANFINPSVVLQPIHELFDFSKRDKILSQTYKIARTPYKVVKSRVNVYNPRRFSTRVINV